MPKPSRRSSGPWLSDVETRRWLAAKLARLASPLRRFASRFASPIRPPIRCGGPSSVVRLTARYGPVSTIPSRSASGRIPGVESSNLRRIISRRLWLQTPSQEHYSPSRISCPLLLERAPSLRLPPTPCINSMLTPHAGGDSLLPGGNGCRRSAGTPQSSCGTES